MKLGNLLTTSNKMMYKTTELQHLMLKMGKYTLHKQQKASHYKSVSVECLWLRLLWHNHSYIYQYQHQWQQVRDYHLLFSLQFDLLLDLPCFTVENTLSHTYVLPNIGCNLFFFYTKRPRKFISRLLQAGKYPIFFTFSYFVGTLRMLQWITITKIAEFSNDEKQDWSNSNMSCFHKHHWSCSHDCEILIEVSRSGVT